MTQINRKHAVAAARAFLEQEPEFIQSAANAAIFESELTRLVDEGHSPTDIRTFRIAYSNIRSQLQLNETAIQKPYSEMTDEELSQVPESLLDKVPARDLKRLSEYQFRQSRVKPPIDETEALIKDIFEGEGFAVDNHNQSVVYNWLQSRGLEFSRHNIIDALDHCEDSLNLSSAMINSLSADTYRRVVVEPEFRKRQEAQPKPTESRVPWGVKYTEWLHNQ